MSGQVPQVCLLFGPSAAGGAYIPAFCDVVVMVEGNASMYLGSPRMAEMVIGEKVTLEEMGGATMHCTVSGCGDVLVQDEDDGDRLLQALPRVHPASFGATRPRVDAARAEARGPATSTDIIPADENKAFDMMAVIDAIVDEGSWLEIKALFAREILTGFARIEGRAVGHRRQPAQVARAACSSSTAPTRRRASSGCATRSTSRCSTWPTCRAS